MDDDSSPFVSESVVPQLKRFVDVRKVPDLVPRVESVPEFLVGHLGFSRRKRHLEIWDQFAIVVVLFGAAFAGLITFAIGKLIRCW